MRLTIMAIAACALTTTLAANAMPPAADLPLPKLRTGIWTTQWYQETLGKPPRQGPERIPNQCGNPTDSVRRALQAGIKEGCEIKVDALSEHKIIYSSTCTAGPLRLTVEAPDPTEYKMTTTSPLASDVETGRWIRNCPTAVELPLPEIKKGIWSVVTRPDTSSPQKFERTVSLCQNPAIFVRDELVAAETKGCSVQNWNMYPHGADYGGDCKGVANSFNLVIGTATPGVFRMTESVGSRMSAMIGRWINDCSASGAVPMPKR